MKGEEVKRFHETSLVSVGGYMVYALYSVWPVIMTTSGTENPNMFGRNRLAEEVMFDGSKQEKMIMFVLSSFSLRFSSAQ